jgi:tetratricopeptide (TPR) repeat protein
MTNDDTKIQNKESFIRVREILSKDKTVLGKTTLMAFVALGLLALAYPAALSSGIAALGIGAVGIFLDHVSEEKLSEKEIKQGVQKIINDNGLLKQKDFYNYMAPIYPKLLQISEEIESFATKEDLIKKIDPLLLELQGISRKIDSLVTKEYLDKALASRNKIIPLQVPEDRLNAARAKLGELPTDKVPEPTTLPAGSHGPEFRSNPRFVGREDKLKQLAIWLKGNEQNAVGSAVAITGMGGVGKTQLAAEAAHRYGQYFAGGVFWLDFSQPDFIPNEIVAYEGVEGDSRPLEEQVKGILAEWQGELPRLLVFDNCEGQDLLNQWLPTTGGCRVIVTTWQNNFGKDLGVRQLPLQSLLRVQSIVLLRSFREDLAQDDPDLNAIADELGDLPLALHMAGKYLERYKFEVSPAKYLDDLRKAKPLHHRSLKQKEFSPTAHDPDVGRTFAVSVGMLSQDETDKLASQILAKVACFAPGTWIPREVLKSSVSEEIGDEQFSDGLTRMENLGLIENNEAGDIWMHRLVASYVQDTRWDEKALEAVEVAVREAANIVNNNGYPVRMLPLLVHLRVLTDQALKRGDRIAAGLANSLGYYLQMVADNAGARPYYEQALAINRKVLGEEHPDTANSLNNLGGLLQNMGDYTGARPYYEQALAIRKKVLGEEHPDTATSLNNLGELLQALGDYVGARPYYEQALAIRRKVLGEERPETATSLNCLGELLQAMGDYVGARPYFEQALAVRRKVLGEEHPDTAGSLNNLGRLLQDKGDTVGAQSYLEQALVVRRKVLGEEHPDTATSLNNLGGLLWAMGDYVGARPYYEQALAIRKKVLGEEHPETATSLINLGELLQALGDYVGARLYFEQGLAINRKVLGEEHPDTATSLNNLGGLLWAMGDYVGARPYFKQALVVYRKVLGEEHPDTAGSLNNLGGLLQDMGDYAGARPFFEQALAILEKKLGKDHPNTLIVRDNLKSLDKSKPDV